MYPPFKKLHTKVPINFLKALGFERINRGWWHVEVDLILGSTMIEHEEPTYYQLMRAIYNAGANRGRNEGCADARETMRKALGL